MKKNLYILTGLFILNTLSAPAFSQSITVTKSVDGPPDWMKGNPSGSLGADLDSINNPKTHNTVDQYIVPTYISGKPAEIVQFAGLEAVAPGKFCNRELSIFYSGMHALGLSWGRLASDVLVPTTIAAVQASLGNAVAGLRVITCLDFNPNRISSFSSRLPGLSRVQAVAEIDALIKEVQVSIQRARITCASGASFSSLFNIGIHLGAAQGISNSFVCRTIPMDWQQNVRNHLGVVSSGISGYSACIPGVSPGITGTVPIGAANAYEPFSVIVGIHIQVLWSVSLSTCCCSCV